MFLLRLTLGVGFKSQLMFTVKVSGNALMLHSVKNLIRYCSDVKHLLLTKLRTTGPTMVQVTTSRQVKSSETADEG